MIENSSGEHACTIRLLICYKDKAAHTILLYIYTNNLIILFEIIAQTLTTHAYSHFYEHTYENPRD